VCGSKKTKGRKKYSQYQLRLPEGDERQEKYSQYQLRLPVPEGDERQEKHLGLNSELYV